MDRLNSKQRRTLNHIFEDPVRSDIPWMEIENLFGALGAIVKSGSGSRVNVFLNGVVGIFHRPHPERVTDKGAVRSVRKFLMNAGVQNGNEL